MTAEDIFEFQEIGSNIARALKDIGKGDVNEPGTLEFIGMQLRDGVLLRLDGHEALSDNVGEVASAIRDVAEAISGLAIELSRVKP